MGFFRKTSVFSGGCVCLLQDEGSPSSVSPAFPAEWWCVLGFGEAVLLLFPCKEADLL